MKREDPFHVTFRFEIAAGGQMLSWFDARAVKPGSPEYESNKHLLWADGSVHRDRRRQGIGRRWIPVVLDIMDRNAYSTVGMGTEEKSGHAFLKCLGADNKFTGPNNRLTLGDLTCALTRPWLT